MDLSFLGGLVLFLTLEVKVLAFIKFQKFLLLVHVTAGKRRCIHELGNLRRLVIRYVKHAGKS